MPPPTLQSLSKEIGEIKAYLNTVHGRLSRLEESAGGSNESVSVQNLSPQKTVQKADGTSSTVSSKTSAAKNEQGFEAKVGLQWLAWIGITCLVLGVGFFLKYAYDNNWIGPLGRVFIGIAAGVALIVIAEFLSKKEKYIRLSQVLTGGGLAAIYFAVYAAYHFPTYQQAIGISKITDMLYLSIVVIFSVFLALRYNSQAIAGGAFFLGYITALLSTEIELFTLIYCLILTVGITIVGAYKKWNGLALGSVIATYFVFILWFSSQNAKDLITALYFLGSYFVIFLVSSFLVSFKPDRDSEIYGIIITLLNSLFFYFQFIYWLQNNYPDYKGILTLILALVYFALWYFASAAGLKKLGMAHQILAVSYLTLSVPIELDKNLITIIWALQSTALIYLGLRTGSKILRILGYCVSGIVLFKTLFLDSWQFAEFNSGNLSASVRLFSFISAVLCLYLSSYFIRKNQKSVLPEEITLARLLYYASCLLSVVIIALEMSSYWITIAWALVASILLFAGIAGGSKENRLLGITLFGVTLVKLFLFDISTLATTYRIISFIGLGVLLLIAAFLYARYKDVILGK